jgi:hypothetical protein
VPDHGTPNYRHSADRRSWQALLVFLDEVFTRHVTW